MKYFLSIMTFIFYLALVSPSWAVHYPPTLNNEGSRTFVVGAVDRMGVISQYGFTFTYVMAGLGALALVIMGFLAGLAGKPRP